MKKIKFILSFLTLILGMLNSSCNSGDAIAELVGKDEYFIVLDKASTNLTDATGTNLGQTFYDSFKFENGKKYQSLGHSYSVPKKVFEESCNNIQKAYQAAYNGKLPEGGYITFVLSLRKDPYIAEVEMTKSITIR